LGAYGLAGYPHNGQTDFGGSGWGYVLVGWVWCIVWYVLFDPIKFLVRGAVKGKMTLWTHRHHTTRNLQPSSAIPGNTVGYSRAGLSFINNTFNSKAQKQVAK